MPQVPTLSQVEWDLMDPQLWHFPQGINNKVHLAMFIEDQNIKNIKFIESSINLLKSRQFKVLFVLSVVLCVGAPSIFVCGILPSVSRQICFVFVVLAMKGMEGQRLLMMTWVCNPMSGLSGSLGAGMGRAEGFICKQIREWGRPH